MLKRRRVPARYNENKQDPLLSRGVIIVLSQRRFDISQVTIQPNRFSFAASNKINKNRDVISQITLSNVSQE